MWDQATRILRGSLPRGFFNFSAGLLLPGVLVTLAVLPATADAKVAAASVFGSHMVLQQSMPVPVWGTADAGEEVTVTFADQTLKTEADAQGKWRVQLASLKATKDQQGQSLTITGSNTITFEDVLIGEVWLCSGQSNMAWQLASSANASEEKKNANYPQIRFLNVGSNRTAREPLDDIRLNWVECNPSTAASFSAVAYFFGRKLHEDLGVPVGLIRSAVGGSVAQAWVGRDALAKNMPEYDKMYHDMVMPGQVLEEKLTAYANDWKTYAEAQKEIVQVEADVTAATKYATADVDDSNWQTMNTPGLWRVKDIPSYDGMAWYRKTIDVPAEWAGKDVLLKLGKISNMDVTWFNGEEVGRMGSWAKNDHRGSSADREYRVPGQFVKAGKNVIAVRVGSNRRGGGFIGDAKKILKAQLADSPDTEAVDLSGDWRFLPVFQMPSVPSDPQSHNRPTILFNGMIHPLIPYAMRGAI